MEETQQHKLVVHLFHDLHIFDIKKNMATSTTNPAMNFKHTYCQGLMIS